MRECAWKAEDKEANMFEKRAHPTAKLSHSISPSSITRPSLNLYTAHAQGDFRHSAQWDKSRHSGNGQRVRDSGREMHARGIAGMHSMLPCSGQRAHQEGAREAFYLQKGVMFGIFYISIFT